MYEFGIDLSRYQGFANACLELIRQREDQIPIVYSRYRFIDESLSSWSAKELNAVWWWLAQYLNDRTREHPGPPILPDRVSPSWVLIHQTADKIPPFGVESAALDYDRWRQVITPAFFFTAQAPPPTLEERITALEARVTALEAR